MPVEEPVEEDVEEADKEAHVGEAPPTADLVPEQVPVLWAILPEAARIWADSPSNQVAR